MLESLLILDLEQALGADAVLTRAIDRISRSSDASFYRKVPAVVVEPEAEDEIAAILSISRKHGIPVTFRAGGTSLSGQSITDGILVCQANRWRHVSVADDGQHLECGPGLRGGEANAHLAPYGRKIGPDPASIDSAMMGGIIANNASGMCCGVRHNAYHTLHSLRMVLPSGTIIDSADPEADTLLKAQEPLLYHKLIALQAEVQSNPALVAKIRRAFMIKNTVGYALNALLDHRSPVQILAHLMVGSEGTLGFVSRIRLNTIAVAPYRATALLLYPDLPSAVGAVSQWTEAGAAAVEFLDRTSLRTMTGSAALPDESTLSPEVTALLVEFHAADADQLTRKLVAIRTDLAAQSLVRPAAFTTDARLRAELWRLRKGLFPAVGARKASGNTVIIEDVAFPADQLCGALLALRALLDRSGYADAVIFGHARDGNCHFVLEQSFHTRDHVSAYEQFMAELVELVLSHQGTLKAEHGTGRNMAPFVEAQWGETATALMWTIKNLLDPEGLLNPGVILSTDPAIHIRDLKPLPAVDPEVDACIECGFCERVCPSRALTLTPRQRIVVRRELAHTQDEAIAEELRVQSQYDLIDTCAADGMCSIACPVDINTGRLVKRLRAEAGAPIGMTAAAQHYGMVRAGGAAAVQVGHLASWVLGESGLNALLSGARALTAAPIPRWSSTLHRPTPLPSPQAGTAGVLIPSCIGSIAGQPRGELSPTTALLELSEQAQQPLHVPDGIRPQCCGLVFDSKGSTDGRQIAASRLVDAAWEWSEAGRLPVIVDVSSCAHALLESRDILPETQQVRLDAMQVTDAVGWLHHILPALSLEKVEAHVVLHPTCSTHHLGLVEEMRAVAEAAAQRVTIPINASCCGMAGDRGLLYPDLPKAALQEEVAQIHEAKADAHYSCSPFCEAGLAQATGTTWHPLVLLLHKAAQAST